MFHIKKKINLVLCKVICLPLNTLAYSLQIQNRFIKSIPAVLCHPYFNCVLIGAQLGVSGLTENWSCFTEKIKHSLLINVHYVNVHTSI